MFVCKNVLDERRRTSQRYSDLSSLYPQQNTDFQIEHVWSEMSKEKRKREKRKEENKRRRYY